MFTFENILTKNEKMLSLINVAKKIASSDISVLITGENGSGKTALAQAIHNASPRKDGPFIAVNCSVIPESHLEAELFGSAKSHGIHPSHKGKFEMAHGGTLLLSEISEINFSVQAKIFQAIESHQITGSSDSTHIDVRLITSTSSNLIELVEQNRFKLDLYYRIREITLEVPPLRDRKEDIPLLAESFIKKFAKDFGKKIIGISDVAMNFLANHEWKGNIRELYNVVRTAVALCEKDRIWLEDIPIRMEFGNESKASAHMISIESFALKDVEKNHIFKTLQHCRWNKSRAAKLLKISRPRLDRKIIEFNLKKPDRQDLKRKK